MSTPIIPPRPQQRTEKIAAEHDAAKLPEIPPRPTSKRSISPANYSPLNDPFNVPRRRSVDPIRRPPSVSRFPSSGEEGMEYGEIQYQPVNPSSGLAADAAAQTRSVDADLKLHAPKPSLPKASAVAQVQAVTRTDSNSAAAHGIVRPPSQEGEPLGRIRSRASFSRPASAASGERRRSVFAEEYAHGPAELGIRVPINPLLGDVQAPSPGPGLSPHHTGELKPHQRSKSRPDSAAPPGSYGLHGHGIATNDKFERDWYAKHPDQLEHEEGQGHGVYESIGSGRGAFAMSSDDLNKIVRGTANRGHGFGTSGAVMSYPDEQIGYAASESYQTRGTLPALQKTVTNPSQESPLRNTSYAADEISAPTQSTSSREQPQGMDAALGDVHIDAPARGFNKISGGEGTLNDTDDVKPYVSHPVDHDHDYSVPILAGDEVAKEVGYEHLHPAVSPLSHRRGSEHEYVEHGSPHTSRPSSRPGSIYQMHSASHSLTRFMSHHESTDHLHTPLENVDEYEPLFPEDDKKKEISMAERFKKRPDTLQHRFPSQDIWEDTPHSAMYEAEVSTPDLPHISQPAKTSFFESPEAEAARKGETSEAEKSKLVSREDQLRKSRFAPHLRDDMPTRPGLQNRFPSQDIWEDSPDSQYLVTTVNAEDDDDSLGPTDVKPVVPTRPAKSRLGEGVSSEQIAPSVPLSDDTSTEKRVHAVPPAGAKLTDTTIPPAELKKVPSIPDRPKPQIPARPAKKPDSEDTRDATVTSPPATKAKPQVPARPAGSKIANLRSNFMNDLNQKLGLGPPKEKEPEPEVEPEDAKPLEDARKGRARGPQRRAPAKSPSSAPTQTSSFSIVMPRTIFAIDYNDSLLVSTLKAQSRLTGDKITQIESSTPADSPLPISDTTTTPRQDTEMAPSEAPKAQAPSLATNTAGESIDPGTAPAEKASNQASKTEHPAAIDQSSSTTTQSQELKESKDDDNVGSDKVEATIPTAE